VADPSVIYMGEIRKRTKLSELRIQSELRRRKIQPLAPPQRGYATAWPRKAVEEMIAELAKPVVKPPPNIAEPAPVVAAVSEKRVPTKPAKANVYDEARVLIRGRMAELEGYLEAVNVLEKYGIDPSAVLDALRKTLGVEL
jgi:hypothetical protein